MTIATEIQETVARDILPRLGILIGIVLVGSLVAVLVRRALSGDGDGDAGVFPLEELRQLHAAGELSDEEFARARARVIGEVRGATEDPDQPTADPGGPASPGSSE